MNSILQDTYRNKKVFITGHTGFKGPWLIYLLQHLGAQVKGYALAPEARSLYRDMNGNQFCDSVEADICDTERLQAEILDFQPDFVFHLAAQSLVRESYATPFSTFQTNSLGTASLLNALRFLEKKCTSILITTDKVYENKEWLYPYRESDRLGGYDPYSASKAAAEIIANSYIQSFFNTQFYDEHQKAFAIARAGNVIGGGDWAKDRLIPDIARALEAQETLVLRSPQATRPWQHVLEPLAGYLLLGAKLDLDIKTYAGAWNFGPDIKDNLTVLEVVKTALQVWGSGDYRIEAANEKMHEANLLRLDISKASNTLGWQPQYDAQTAIAKTMAWYRGYFENPKSVIQLMQTDVNAYLK